MSEYGNTIGVPRQCSPQQNRENYTYSDVIPAVNGWLSPLVSRLANPIPEIPESREQEHFVPVYPSVAAAILRAKNAAAGRVWLLLHNHFNRAGRQVVNEDEIIDLLCSTESPLRLFTVRQWRNIRKEGDGRFWDVLTGGQVFIYGMAHTADSMNVDRLSGRRVNVPMSSLVKSTKEAKRILYLTFDASRDAMPISRATREDITGIDRSSQWRIERKSPEIEVTPNYEIVTPLADCQTVENAAYRFGGASFVFTDRLGKQGAAGEKYLARQMPNSYTCSLENAPRGRQKKLNRRLRTPVTTWSGESASKTVQLYFDDGNQAEQATCAAVTMRTQPARNGSGMWANIQR